MISTVAYGVVTGLGLAAAPLWWLYRRLKQERALSGVLTDRLAALLTTAPSAGCGWPLESTATAPGFVAADLAPLLGLAGVGRPEDIATALAPTDSSAFLHAINALRDNGQGFRLEIATRDGLTRLMVSGRRQDDHLVLWFEDAGELAAERARGTAALAALAVAESRADTLQAVLDTLPVPAWLRRDDLSLTWCNAAYATALDTTPDAIVSAGSELGSGKALAKRVRTEGIARTEARRVVIGSDRHVIEVTESPLGGPGHGQRQGATGIGFAIDRTREEAIRADLGRHVTAHAAVLEQLGSAIAVYGADRRLSFYNQAYVRLWGLDESWLATLPGFGEVLEELRTRRRLPEYADFPHYKKENLALFTGLIEPREDLMHLPDGTTLRVLIVPHSFGGLMFVLEDVTNSLALESSYNILMAVQQETLNNLAEGIAVFGGDGRLKLSNPAYAAMWGLSPDDLAGEPHIADIMEKVRALLDLGEDWPGLKSQMVSAALERVARDGRLQRTDGTVLNFANVPLPDGAVLTTYLDVTDRVKVEQALRARNAALADADRLKNEFLANVSYHLRTPLNSIMGFAEMLSQQYVGSLNERQLEYSHNVLASGTHLLSMINDILDLATIEAGYMALDQGPVNISTLFDGVAGLAREWTAKQSLRLEIDCPGDIGEIEADEKRLKQALLTLISNAIHFSPTGGTITLTARRREDGLVLTVRDAIASANTGDDNRQPIERFEPSRPFGTTTGDDNAGIGLALVKSFVELHGGQIGIEGCFGQGTAIHCILPTGTGGQAVPGN
ncbi:MAG: PAS-domain containing protein [Rhodospirillaceae bacterium]